jgi:hypothetical protein
MTFSTPALVLVLIVGLVLGGVIATLVVTPPPGRTVTVTQPVTATIATQTVTHTITHTFFTTIQGQTVSTYVTVTHTVREDLITEGKLLVDTEGTITREEVSFRDNYAIRFIPARPQIRVEFTMSALHPWIVKFRSPCEIKIWYLQAPDQWLVADSLRATQTWDFTVPYVIVDTIQLKKIDVEHAVTLYCGVIRDPSSATVSWSLRLYEISP